MERFIDDAKRENATPDPKLSECVPSFKSIYGPEFWANFNKTSPGRLSSLIDEILYNSSTASGVIGQKSIVLPLTTFWSASHGGDDRSHDTLQILRTVRDFLEAHATAELLRGRS